VLKKWVIENRGVWDLLLRRVCFAHNTLVHTVHNHAPALLMHGFEPRTILDVVMPRQDERGVTQHEYARKVVEEMKRVHAFVKQAYEEVNEKRVKEPDHGAVPELKIGDEVLVYDPTHKKGESTKLKLRWKGPFPIIHQVTPVTYQLMVNGVLKTKHVESLKKYVSGEDDEHDVYDAQLAMIDEEIAAIDETQQRMMMSKLAKRVEKQQVEDEKQKRDAKSESKDEAAEEQDKAVESSTSTATTTATNSGQQESGCMTIMVVSDAFEIDIN